MEVKHGRIREAAVGHQSDNKKYVFNKLDIMAYPLRYSRCRLRQSR